MEYLQETENGWGRFRITECARRYGRGGLIAAEHEKRV